MSIRESLSKKPAIAVGVVSGLVVFSTALLAYNLRGEPPTRAGAAHYSDDDGVTWFVDAPDRLPPFDHGGKPAVRATVFVDAGGKERVGFLERYKPDARSAIAKALDVAAKDPQHATTVPLLGDRSALEVKLPGNDKPWVNEISEAGQKIMNATAPGGGPLTAVVP